MLCSLLQELPNMGSENWCSKEHGPLVYINMPGAMVLKPLICACKEALPESVRHKLTRTQVPKRCK